MAILKKKEQQVFIEGKSIASVDVARSLIGDGVGIRAFIKSNSEGVIDQRAVQTLVMRLVKSIEDGKIKITEILNYRTQGENAISYMTDEQIKLIVEADLKLGMKLKAKGLPHKAIVVKNGPGAYLDMGYTSFHFNFANSDEIRE